MGPLILIAEDDADIRSLLRLYLEGEGMRVLEAADGNTALELAREHTPDMAILDVMMPGLNGFELTRALRQYSDLPILILSAKSQDNDKILGLNLGADDYIAKPFNPVEIAARVKAQLRRTARRSGNVLTVRDLALDTASFQLTKRGEPILLTPMEYKILAMLMRSPGRIFTKIQLYEGAIGTYFEGDDNTMMVHISKLRDKLEDDPRHPQYIITVRGLGYKLEK
ncbi:response regulator transcription factor [Pseudoflavonifractor gallinarum]|uniref:Stage 0 sporulation protein A homolog n=1 Tax=Pseudoflavonifractor hominis TaxID=2763059 RepID=A0ABR7HQC2_9FIRM|nr:MULTISPECIES: response regulator transcription factor [Pseudoflavonifractor]MBC5729719.1 response regulator transcription factor [Pseudoflavonifractor hominis]MBS5134164.1 response regulator transcription factor [Oscillospiraceae bacterium]MBT9685277.1 response regulator [Pseudoflavonifractor sp. MCC625]